MLKIAALLIVSLAVAHGAGGNQKNQTALVFDRDQLFLTSVTGLENTGATAVPFDVSGPNFNRALRVSIGKESPETNATQLTVLNQRPVRKDDVLVAEFWVRGQTRGKKPSQVAFLFERSTDPWTKSHSEGVSTSVVPTQWKQFKRAFKSAETYAPGQVMASIRLAFGPQTVEIGGFSVLNLGQSRTVDAVNDEIQSSLPPVVAAFKVESSKTVQTLRGFGGNFCQPRYGSTEPMDAVGELALKTLNVRHVRVGLPLNHWTPTKGTYVDDKQAKASFLALQRLSKLKVPMVVSVWEGPLWLQGGQAEQMGRVLPPEKYADCIDAIAEYLRVGKTKYGVEPDFLSFNEPDYGVNFKFNPGQMIEFVRQSGAKFKRLGLKTKWIVADTANGVACANFARPMLEDKSIASYLGPIGFHSWDALNANPASYEAIAALGKKYNKEIWCLEAGHDAQLWQRPNPWATWDNAFRTAMAYEITLRLSGASVMDYWTYQDNYALGSSDGKTAFPVMRVMSQMEKVYAPGYKLAQATGASDEVQFSATVDTAKEVHAIILSTRKATVAVTGLTPAKNYALVRSTETAQNKSELVRTDANGKLNIALSAREIITLHPRR